MLTRCLSRLLLSAGLLSCLSLAVAASEKVLPRFTEEREAAALHFIKKHAPDMAPLLEQLKKNNLPQYKQEIREVFQVTEMLAELEDEPRRHELELRIWTTESRAIAMVAKLSTPKDEERKTVEEGLFNLARELAELDIQVLELKADQLDKELGELKDELARAREQMKENAKARYEELVSQAKRRVSKK